MYKFLISSARKGSIFASWVDNRGSIRASMSRSSPLLASTSHDGYPLASIRISACEALSRSREYVRAHPSYRIERVSGVSTN